jgi:hypothetical protein
MSSCAHKTQSDGPHQIQNALASCWYKTHQQLAQTYTRGSQKVPGNVVQHCNGRTYDKAYLITFKVEPLRTHTHTHTLAPSILPLLEAPTEGFFWNLPKFGRRIRCLPLLCSNSLPRKAFQSSPKHRTLRISLQVTFRCSLL